MVLLDSRARTVVWNTASRDIYFYDLKNMLDLGIVFPHPHSGKLLRS